MKIGILIPSDQQKSQAGVRIRYSRIEPELRRRGHALDLIPIQDLGGASALVHDAYIISKCYDARSLIIARHLKQAGKHVGVDLFDDYFSQHEDSRFVRLRYWLRTLMDYCSFILCSTPRMGEVARDYAPGLSVHVMNDAAAAIGAQAIAAAAAVKLQAARKHRRIDVAWFGIGDNPSFPVGLADLAAFGSEVDRMRGHGYDVRLEVLTNRRSLTAESLAGLARLATPHVIDEWDEAREAELLARSLVCFLPVNAQNFSRAKSLNRAVTALAAGTQVLSAGYPLYEAFRPFVYRDARHFVGDLRSGKLALRAENAADLAERLSTLASIGHEAEALGTFLVDVCQQQNSPVKSSPCAVIHGKETTADIHKLAQRMGLLSVASPFSNAKLNCDLRFAFAPGGQGFEIHIGSKKAELLAPAIRQHLASHGNLVTGQHKRLLSAQAFPGLEVKGAALAALNTAGGDTAAYPLVMEGMREAMRRMFPGITFLHAEQSKLLPWLPASRQGHGRDSAE